MRRTSGARHFGAFAPLLGKIVPDWWTSGWLNARYLARHLGAKILIGERLELDGDGIGRWPRRILLKIAVGVELHLRGQIDLVLAQNDALSFTGQNIWIVDYKTGSDRELKRPRSARQSGQRHKLAVEWLFMH